MERSLRLDEYRSRPTTRLNFCLRLLGVRIMASSVLDETGLPRQQDPDPDVLVQVCCLRERHIQILG